MLYLNPPFVTVKGVSAYPDHADPLQWYYLPMSPRLSVREDGGHEVPAFSLIQFVGGTGATGGLLTFDVDLRLDDGVIEEVAGEIRGALHLPTTPNLAPVPLEDGTVSLTVLTTDDAAPPAGATPRFSVRSVHAARPSLYGTNRAAFSVALDQDSSVLVERSLDGELVPIGVVYDLAFLALRPAYAVRLHIDWERVQHRLDEMFEVDEVFTSAQISEAVDELDEKKVIDLQDDLFVPEGEDSASVVRNRDRALAQVQDMITDAFFTASIDPQREPPDGWDRAIELHDDFQRSVVTGGGLLPTFTYTRADYRRVDRKRLDVNFSERVTVRRSIHPQAHLTGIGAAIKASGLPRDTFVRKIDLDDPWFHRRRVRVQSRVDLAALQISSVEVELRYHDQVRGVVIDQPDQAKDVEWASVVVDGAMDMPVQGRMVLNLAPVDDVERPARIEAPPKVVETEAWNLDATALLRAETVPIRTDGVPWERWSKVEVTIRYADAERGVRQQSTLELDQQRPGWDYVLFVMTGGTTTFDYRVRYIGRDGRQDHVREWTTIDEGEVRLRDPFPTKRGVMVVPQLPWAEVERMFVDLRYEDPAHDIRYETTLDFDQGHKAPGTFDVDLRDPLRRRVWWKALVLYTDGRSVDVGPSETTDSRIVVRPDMPRHRVVSVSADLTGPDAKGVADVVVTVTRPGSDQVVAELTFRPGDPPQEFGFDHTSDADAAYRYALVYHHTNGLRRTRDPLESRAADLVVDAG